mgnify:CR=1 FL=1
MGSFNDFLDAEFRPPRNWSLNAPLKFKSATLTKEERELKENSIITMRRIMSWLVIVNMVIIIVGFIYYFGMKKMQHGKQFSLQQFFFDVPICGYTISKNKKLKPFIRAFKS